MGARCECRWDILPQLNLVQGVEDGKEDTNTARESEHFYGPGPTGRMHYLPDFSLLMTLRNG